MKLFFDGHYLGKDEVFICESCRGRKDVVNPDHIYKPVWVATRVEFVEGKTLPCQPVKKCSDCAEFDKRNHYGPVGNSPERPNELRSRTEGVRVETVGKHGWVGKQRRIKHGSVDRWALLEGKGS